MKLIASWPGGFGRVVAIEQPWQTWQKASRVILSKIHRGESAIHCLELREAETAISAKYNFRFVVFRWTGTPENLYAAPPYTVSLNATKERQAKKQFKDLWNFFDGHDWPAEVVPGGFIWDAQGVMSFTPTPNKPQPKPPRPTIMESDIIEAQGKLIDAPKRRREDIAIAANWQKWQNYTAAELAAAITEKTGIKITPQAAKKRRERLGLTTSRLTGPPPRE